MSSRQLSSRALVRPGKIAAAMFAGLLGCLGTKQAAQAREISQVISIPYAEAGVSMKATLFRPPGKGPFPLAVVSHGSSESAEARALYDMPQFTAIVSLLLRRGYVVVLPQRPGHGHTGGPYLESAGECENADFAAAGDAAGRSILVAINFLLRESFVRQAPVLIVGHSAGAWGSLSLASKRGDLIGRVVNFAGGLGGHAYAYSNRNCSPERLISVAAQIGRTTRIPTLWLYAENDTYFPPALARSMAAAYQAAGANVELHILRSIGEEGHFIAFSGAAAPVWLPLVETFLDQTKSGKPRK